jgi:hypothetical protein
MINKNIDIDGNDAIDRETGLSSFKLEMEMALDDYLSKVNELCAMNEEIYGLVCEECGDMPEEQLRARLKSRVLTEEESREYFKIVSDMNILEDRFYVWINIIEKEVDRLNGELVFETFEQVTNVMMELRDKYSDSILMDLAFRSFYILAPENIKEMLSQKMVEMFPELEITHHDGQGKLYMTLESVQNALGLSEDEIVEQLGNTGELVSSDNLFPIARC